jgi:Predicted membrane protein (DUF2339)
MEDILLALLCVAVLWLVIRQLRQKRRDHLLNSFNEMLAGLDRRLTRLEELTKAAAAPIPAPQPHAPAPVIPLTVALPPPPAPTPTWVSATQPTPVAAPPLRTPPPPAPSFTPPPPPPSFTPAQQPHRSISLEERLGQNWLNKLGIVTLVIGLALFLGYQLRTLGPAGKSAIGLILSVAILAAGLILERRPNYRIFARAAIGGGWALTFFVTFAIYHVTAMKVLDSQALDLILMFVIASAMVVHSLRYHSQVVTSLAFLLAFVTVGISEVTLFSLVTGALLAAGLVYVSAREYWYELGLCGLIGVYLNHFLWLHRVLPDGAIPGRPFPQFIPSAALLLIYWLLFRLVYVFRIPRNERQQNLASITAILNSIGLMSLLKYQSSHPEWAFYALLALGTAEMTLAFLARPRIRSAFIILSTIASVLLLAAIPFHFSGADWTFFWLLEAELLFLAGIRLPEPVFRRLGLLAAFAVSAKLLFIDAPLIYTLRQQQPPDTTHHLAVALTFLCAAVLFWLNSEFAPRRWSLTASHDFDIVALTVTSYLAATMAPIGLWILIPGSWTIVAWLALTLTLGLIADKLSSSNLATQADLIAITAIIRTIFINLQTDAHLGRLTLRAITFTIAAALLYLCARRHTRALAITRDYIAPAYTWVAAAIIATLLWYELQPIAVAVAWATFALILFELGLSLRRNYLRHQAYALLAAAFIRIFFANLNVPSTQLLSPRLYTVVPLIAAWLWIYHRLTTDEAAQQSTQPKLDHHAATISAWCATIAAVSLLYFELRAPWIAIAWSILALILITTAFILKRPLFTAQSLAVLLAAALRALLYNIFSTPALATTPTTSRVFTIALTCALMFAALPIAFRLRSRNPNTNENPLHLLLTHPEQSFFFVPLTLLATLLAVQLRAGMITVGWSVLGVLTFLFALTVAERSFRLAGLALLLLGVGKILCVDIWHAAPTDRYITLIVMGAALLLVSFLYSRYRETLLKLL